MIFGLEKVNKMPKLNMKYMGVRDTNSGRGEFLSFTEMKVNYNFSFLNKD